MMNWRSITIEPPCNVLLLFRMERTGLRTHTLMLGYVSGNGEIFFKTSLLNYKYFAKIEDLTLEGVDAMFWVDPREIL